MHALYDILHILGIALFFGGMAGSLVWVFLAEKSRQATVVRIAVVRAYWINMSVTAPGIALIILSGLFQMPRAEGVLLQSWLAVGLVLFVLSVLAWLLFFIPSLIRTMHMSRSFHDVFPPDFFIALHRLYFFGAIIIILPLGTMFLSIVKPILW